MSDRVAVMSGGRIEQIGTPAEVYESPLTVFVAAGMERTVYVGASIQVMLRLANGATLQASVANTGDAAEYRHGTPLYAHVPADGLRVLAPAAGASAPTALRKPQADQAQAGQAQASAPA